MLCQHALILLPLIVAAMELVGPIFRQASSLAYLGFVVVVFIVAPKRCAIGDWRRVLPSALISAGGALATFFLANSLDLGALVASAVVGLAGTAFLKEEDQLTLYLGAFVGMSSVARFPTLGPLFVAGLVGGVLWEILNQTWNGVGGRLGTVAATAVLVILLTLGGGL
jgi:hypothetical protein